MKFTALTAVLGMTATSALAQGLAGYEPVSFPVAHHDGMIEGAIWYPATGGGTEVLIGENGVFHGTPVLELADPATGSFPVVVVSHGLGGNIRTLSWLTAGLAAKGAVVVSLNHPSSTTRDFDLLKGLDHWTRVQDLQAALDKLMAEPRFAGQLDMSRIMAAGFSYGGWTALSMGGLTEPDVAGLVDDVLLIGLGEGKDRLLATDFSAGGSGFAALLPDAKVETKTPASHYAALLPCKPAGPAILIEEGDDPVCDNPVGLDRAALHRQIVDRIAEQLGL